jgi:Transposase DDE domain
MFLDMLLFKVFDNGTVSLNDHSVYVGMEHQVQIRKQSIDDRFTDKSVEFVRTLLEQHISTQITKHIDVECLKNFTSVKIKGSTRFQIPDHLKEAYPGNGGLASEAGIHVQFEVDLLSGKVNDLYVTDSLHQDTTDAKQTVEMIERGSLILRDLGYFSSKTLQEIVLRKAFYISRLDHKINIYTLKKNGRYKELDRKKIHAYLKRTGLLARELEVYIGEDKVPVRLIAEMMPEEELNNRLAKARKGARRRGTGLSDRYIAAASLNLFVTNVPLQWVAAKEIRTLYRLRWQIELRFKTWKSFSRLHAGKKMKLHRFETYLYACLLFILINWEITAGLLSFVWQQRRKLISIIKCYKAIIQSVAQLKEALFDADQKFQRYLEILYQMSFKELLIEKRKGHLSQEEILLFNLEITEQIC